MERMEEQVIGSAYRQYQHFLSNSRWDPVPVIHQVAQDMSAVCAAQKAKKATPTGLLVDESAHLKKGTASVGVGRTICRRGWKSGQLSGGGLCLIMQRHVRDPDE